VNPTTAEISGIAPALDTGYTPDILVVYARKTKPFTMTDTVFLTSALSHTKQRGGEDHGLARVSARQRMVVDR